MLSLFGWQEFFFVFSGFIGEATEAVRDTSKPWLGDQTMGICSFSLVTFNSQF
jgi:hypothetical protein